jgi:hypothetical protein
MFHKLSLHVEKFLADSAYDAYRNKITRNPEVESYSIHRSKIHETLKAKLQKRRWSVARTSDIHGIARTSLKKW